MSRRKELRAFFLGKTRKIFGYLGVIALALSLAGCSNTTNPKAASATLKFEFNLPGAQAQQDQAQAQKSSSVFTAQNSSDIPAYILVSLSDKNNTPVDDYQRKKITLATFGSAYISTPLRILAGDYKVTEFIVFNAQDKAICATPLRGSTYAHLVSTPLSHDITAQDEQIQNIAMQVVPIRENDNPTTFGYLTFTFEKIDALKFQTVAYAFDLNQMAYAFITANLTVDTPSQKTRQWTLAPGFNTFVEAVETGLYKLTAVNPITNEHIFKSLSAESLQESTTVAPIEFHFRHASQILQSLALPSENLSIEKGTSLPFSATLTPPSIDTDLVWTVADPSIATYNNGNIIGLSKGVTALTVSSLQFPNVSYSIIVSVWEAEKFRLASAGGWHTHLVTTDGRLFAAGRNDEGQLGDGSGNHRQAFIHIALSGDTANKQIDDIQSGGRFTYIRSGKELFATGANDFQQLGRPSSVTRMHYFVRSWSGPDGEVKDFSVGKGQSFIIKGDSIHMVGKNNNHQLGPIAGVSHYGGVWGYQNPLGNANWPNVQFISTPVLVAAGGGFTIVIDETGRPYIAGRMPHTSSKIIYGQHWRALNDGHTLVRFKDADANGIDGDVGHALAVSESGAVYALGATTYGATTLSYSSQDFRPTSLSSGMIKVAAGRHHSFALHENGTLYATGLNGNGQLGTTDTLDRNEWTAVLNDVVAISAGNYHSVALKSDGSAWTVGKNEYGQLGLGHDAERYTWQRIIILK